MNTNSPTTADDSTTSRDAAGNTSAAAYDHSEADDNFESYNHSESSVHAISHHSTDAINSQKPPAVAERCPTATPDDSTHRHSSEAYSIQDSLADHDYGWTPPARNNNATNVSPESVMLNSQTERVNDPAEPPTSCNCRQRPLRLERKLSLPELQKLATEEAPHWKANDARACPVCSNNIRTNGLVSNGLQHLWYHSMSDLSLRRCPCDECPYSSADRTSIRRHYSRHHGAWTPTVREASKQKQNIRHYRTLLKKLSSRKSKSGTVKRQKRNASTMITPDDLERHTATTAQQWKPSKQIKCPVCQQQLVSRRFCNIVLHLLSHADSSHHLYRCPARLCEYSYNGRAYMKRHYKHIHGEWTPRIRRLSLKATSYNQYVSLLRLGHQVITQVRSDTRRRRNTAAEEVLDAIPNDHTVEANEVRLPLQQNPVYGNDEEHLDAFDELSLMANWPSPTNATTLAQWSPAPYPTNRTVLPETASPTSVLLDFAKVLSRFDPDSETFVIFKTYVVFFESTHATPWWISVDSPLRQRHFRDVLQQTIRRQKQNLIIVSCELQQNQCSNLAQTLCKHLDVTDLIMPNDPSFLRNPEKRKLMQLVNAFPMTLKKLYNLPYPSMLAREGRTLFGRHEVRTVGSPSNNCVDLLFNFTRSNPEDCRLSVAYQNATHLCRNFLPDADYTDLEVRMTTTFTRKTLMQLLHRADQLMSTTNTLRSTTVYITHEEPRESPANVHFEASVGLFRSHWNALWTWISTMPKPCNICYTYSSPTTKPPAPAIEVPGAPLLTPVTPTTYSNATTSTQGRNIISILDLTAKEYPAATPTGSPFERKLHSALKNLFDDTFRQQDAATLQTTTALEAEPTLQAITSSEDEPLQLRTTVTTPLPTKPSARMLTATHNIMERPPPNSDDGVATPSSL